MKATSAIIRSERRRSSCRKSTKKTDWEVELGVVIGTRAKYVDEADALDYVAGYCVVNDVSEREFQIERGGHGTKARAATPSARSAPGWSPRTKSPTRRT